MKNYKIRRESECNCFVSDITEDQGVVMDCNDTCWQSNVLAINGEDVLEYVQFEGFKTLNDALILDRIPEDALDDMRIGELQENPDHDDDAMSAKILDYLEGLPEGTRFFRDNERNFANEYCSIIVTPDADNDDIDEDWDEIDAEQCAHDIAYSGDAATQAYNSIKVIG